MRRMTKQNLNNIKCIFEEKTGTDLNPNHRMHTRRPMKRMLLIAAVIGVCLLMAAFTYPLFTPLDGDELSLSGTYEGNGIVSVHVENGSDKALEFQKQTKLMRWASSEEVERTGGDARFENTKFPPHSSGIMTIDLSEAYDIDALENPEYNPEWYYLLLTNNSFLFGHDWMCSVDFVEIETGKEKSSHVAAEAEFVQDIEEELRFYFEDAYHDEIMGRNEQNFAYLQKVDEAIKRFDGNVVAPVYPMIMVSGPSTFLDPQPRIRGDVQNADSDWTPLDGYSRLLGATTSEKALTVMANIPSLRNPDSTSSIPLVYTFVFEAAAVGEEDYAFVYGQFHSFADLESSKVYEDEHYIIYNMTDSLYTDLDAYIDYIQTTREDLLIDESVRQGIHDIYDYYMEKENLSQAIYYPVNE